MTLTPRGLFRILAWAQYKLIILEEWAAKTERRTQRRMNETYERICDERGL